MRGVVDYRAAVLARRARVASGRDMKRDRQIKILNDRPHRVEDLHVVIRMTCIVTAEDRLARQPPPTESQLRDPLDFLHPQAHVPRPPPPLPPHPPVPSPHTL